MAQVTLDLAQRNRLVSLLAERVGLTPLQRETMLDEAGLAAFRTELTFDAEAATFAAQLVRELQARGTLEETGQPALVSLLRWLREEVRGHAEDAAFLDGLLAPYRDGDPTADSDLRLKQPRHDAAAIRYGPSLDPGPTGVGPRVSAGVKRFPRRLLRTLAAILLVMLLVLFTRYSGWAPESMGDNRVVLTSPTGYNVGRVVDVTMDIPSTTGPRGATQVVERNVDQELLAAWENGLFYANEYPTEEVSVIRETSDYTLLAVRADSALNTTVDWRISSKRNALMKIAVYILFSSHDTNVARERFLAGSIESAQYSASDRSISIVFRIENGEE